MKLNLFARSVPARTISALYGAIVAQARRPVFYRDLGVPDTVNGRFDMIVLHLALFLDRMESDARHRDIGQRVFDLFCAEMDGHLRETGVGDLTVPKRMKEIGESFYGRRQAYRAALALPDDGALQAAVRRNVYGGADAGAPLAVARLAAYMRQAQGLLAAQDGFLQGHLQWPDPDAASGEILAAPTGAPP
jgi:cytochrome b pre-mRNA-processing protein 3